MSLCCMDRVFLLRSSVFAKPKTTSEPEQTARPSTDAPISSASRKRKPTSQPDHAQNAPQGKKRKIKATKTSPANGVTRSASRKRKATSEPGSEPEDTQDIPVGKKPKTQDTIPSADAEFTTAPTRKSRCMDERLQGGCSEADRLQRCLITSNSNIQD